MGDITLQVCALSAAVDARACVDAAAAAVGAAPPQQRQQSTEAVEAAALELERAAAVEATAADDDEEAMAKDAAEENDEEAAVTASEEIAAVECDDEEEVEVPERHAHSAGVGKRQAVDRAPVSKTPAPAPRSKKTGLLGERARPGIKKDMSAPGASYARNIYKENKKEEQQARVQNIFYELRAEGYGPNEAAAVALERASGGGQQ